MNVTTELPPAPPRIPGEDDVTLDEKIDAIAEEWAASEYPDVIEIKKDELTQGVADFFDTCDGKIEWLLEPFVVKGAFTVVIGAPKSGKTFFTAWLAASIAANTKRVVFVEEEGAKEVLRDRLSPFLQPDPRAYNESLRIIFRRNVKLDSDRSVRALIAACSGADCLVLDPFVALHAQDENDSGQIGPVLQAIQQIMSACPGLAVVLIHHTRKGGSWDKEASQDASSADARGSGALVGAADQIISIKAVAGSKRVANEVRFYVENPDTRLSAPFNKKLAVISLDGGVGALRWEEEERKNDDEAELLERMLLVLQPAPVYLGQQKIRQALRAKIDRVRAAIFLGLERNIIVQTSNGVALSTHYRVTAGNSG